MIRDQSAMDELLDRTRAFVRDVAIPTEDRTEAEDKVPDEAVAAMRELGTFGWSIPEEYGGSGLTSEELALAFIELTQCSRLATGELLGCLALTEPEAGSDATAQQTTAVLQDDGSYLLNGMKRYITLAPIADLFTVFARTDDRARGAGGITAFAIERGTPGLTTSGSTPKMGQEGAPIGEVYLKDCVVSAVIGEVGEGFRTVMKTLNKQRINLAALSTGPAIRMLDEAVRYTLERKQGGRPIAEYQLIQGMLAECKVDIESTRALILETARKRDRDEDVLWTCPCANTWRRKCAAGSRTRWCRSSADRAM